MKKAVEMKTTYHNVSMVILLHLVAWSTEIKCVRTKMPQTQILRSFLNQLRSFLNQFRSLFNQFQSGFLTNFDRFFNQFRSFLTNFDSFLTNFDHWLTNFDRLLTISITVNQFLSLVNQFLPLVNQCTYWSEDLLRGTVSCQTVWCEFITMVGHYVSRTRLCDVKKHKDSVTIFCFVLNRSPLNLIMNRTIF